MRLPNLVLMSSPLFSVVIPAFNREQTIEQTLRSVLRQNFEDYEIVVVDDGSTDETASVAAEFGGVRLIRSSNAGPGGARNLGVESARGRYVAFLDSDDLWFPWTLDVTQKLIHKHDFPSLLAGSFVEFEEDSEFDRLVLNGPVGSESTAFESFLDAQKVKDTFVGAGLLTVSREAFIATGGFTIAINNCEDHDFMLLSGISGNFVSIDSPTTIAWRRHSGGTTQNELESLRGINFLIESEINGRYPGGITNQPMRRRFICKRANAVSLGLLSKNYRIRAISLFVRTILWNLKSHHFKFLAGFPLRFIASFVGSQS